MDEKRERETERERERERERESERDRKTERQRKAVGRSQLSQTRNAKLATNSSKMNLRRREMEEREDHEKKGAAGTRGG